jgi:hypothetical protein
MECISTVSFSILVNGGIIKHFHPSRGLRQGDLSSPYLFIMCQEVLSRLIDREFLRGAINGVKMNVAGPAFTHVMYADGIMLFAKANSSEVKILDECLDTYCNWSDQRVNRNKSGMIFSKLVLRDKRREVKVLLGMQKILPNATYLGGPHCFSLLAGLETSNSFRINLRPDFWDGEVKRSLGLEKLL